LTIPRGHNGRADKESEEEMSLTFIDFFAGIGGFRKGLETAGHKCVGYCEIDKFASASYRMMHTVTVFSLAGLGR